MFMFSGVVVNFIGLLNPELLILNDCKMKLALLPVQIRVFSLGIPLFIFTFYFGNCSSSVFIPSLCVLSSVEEKRVRVREKRRRRREKNCEKYGDKHR